MSTRRRVLTTASAGAVVLLLAACTSGTGTKSSSGTTAVLNVGMLADSASLDPVLAAPAVYAYFAYDPLIYKSAAGKYEPDLASSWKFTDTKNEVFEVTLRSGAKFSDGTSVTAAAAAASMNRFVKTPGLNQTNSGPVKSVEAVGTSTVRITYSEPVPLDYAQKSLTQDFNFGLITSEKATKNPKLLTTATAGAGEYTIDPAQTTKGSVYTYVPNKHYFNQAAIKFAKVVVKPFTDPNARVSALQTGQIDWAHDIPSGTIAAVKKGGSQVSNGPGNRVLFLLENRTSGPLANVKVRQAIAYAIDRDAILKSVYAGSGVATSSFGTQDQLGYNTANPDPYPYNLAKAKQLLAQAGYAKGFTLSSVDAGAIDPNGAGAQAIASDLAKVGITLNLKLENGAIGTYVGELMSKKFQTTVFSFKNGDIYTTIKQFLTPGNLGNVFGTPATSADLNGLLLSAAGQTSSDVQQTDMAKVTSYLDGQVWGVPIALNYSSQGISKQLKNVPTTFDTFDMDPVSPIASQNWHK